MSPEGGVLLDPTIGWALLAAFSVVWIWLGILWGRRARSLDGFMVAGRNVGLALGAATAMATWVTSNTTMLAPQFALELGVWGMLAYSTASLGLVLFAPLASRIRALMPKGFTSAEFIERRYGRAAWGVFMLLSLFYAVTWLVSMGMAGGLLIEALSGIDYLYGMTIVLVVCTAYTCAGGLYAVIGTDFIQSLIVLVGLVVVGVAVLGEVSTSEVHATLVERRPMLLEVMMPAALLALFNNLLFGMGEVFHSNVWWSRAFSMRPGVGLKAYLLAGMCWLPVPVAAGFLGLASLFRKTPRRIAPRRSAALKKIDARVAEEGARAVLVSIDRDWGERSLWLLVKRLSGAQTDGYYLSALDRERGPEGEIRLKPDYARIHVDLFWRTLWMSGLITLFGLLLAYPASYLLAALPPRRANLLMILVLLPLWTSLLARTSAWQVLLQDQGVVNDVLLASGLNSALYWTLSWFGAPETESLCRNDLRQIIAGGAEVVTLMASNAELTLSSCAREVIAVLQAQGDAAAIRAAQELQAAGEASGYGDERFTMANNSTGVVIAMTHILLPFAILPLYAVMKTIPPDHVRAAKSLGATNWTAFWRVYFPASLPGVAAGAVLVFILSVGYYITPEILGGAKGRFVSNQIAYHITESLNWGLAAALAALLLALVLSLYFLFNRLSGADGVRLG